MKIRRMLAGGAADLIEGGLTDGAGEAALLLGHCLGMNRTELFLHADAEVDPQDGRRFQELIARRRSREPYAYIIGEKEFWSLPFYVDRSVLIPRPETEFLVEVVLKSVRGSALAVDRCIDLCSGSGVIAVVLAMELGITTVALDSSAEALAVLQRNTRRHGLEARVLPLCSDLFTAISPEEPFPLIVSNPPYVRRRAIEQELEPDVACFEPLAALDGGEDGLGIIRRIAAAVLAHLAPGGCFFMEFGAEQGGAVQELFRKAKWRQRCFTEVEILQDYSGNDRVLCARSAAERRP